MDQDTTEDYSRDSHKEVEVTQPLVKKIKKLKRKVKRLETQFASLCKLVNCTVAFFPGDKVPTVPDMAADSL